MEENTLVHGTRKMKCTVLVFLYLKMVVYIRAECEKENEKVMADIFMLMELIMREKWLIIRPTGMESW